MQSLIPMMLILLGIVGITIYVLTMALRDALRQIVQMNERLLILVGTRDGNEAVGRALVASSRRPTKPLPGVATPKKSETKQKPPFTETMGVT